jgi:hypothetical protein
MTRYSIIEADVQNNRDDILPILMKNLTGPSLNKYVWNYNQCPYGVARCWLAKHEESNTFIGTTALFPRVILVKGEPVYAAIAGDFAVDIQHRNLRPALALQKEIQSKIHDTKFKFIYGLPNKQAKGILLRLGYKKIGRFTHFIKPLKSEYQYNKYIHSFLQFKIFAKAVDFLIKSFAKENRYKTTLKYSIITPEYFDDRFDVFWKNVSKHFTIIGERTSIFLNWRYIQSPVKKYKIFCLSDEHNDIIGYSVYFLENNMCYIMDMLFEPSTEVISLLLAEFSRFIRMKGVGSISVDYLGGSLLEKKLREFNFLPIKNEMDLIIYNPNMADNTDLLNKENWHFFAGDNDV